MIFNYRYGGTTQVASNASQTAMSFAPDTFREPTFFVGTLAKNLPFREAISALHHVVVSDLRFTPKDRLEYKEWAAQQEEIMLAQYMAEQDAKAATLKAKVELIRQELASIGNESSKIMDPYYKARRKYFDYLYQKDKDAWFVLDPVITVHPDQLFFECFSQDESSYGCLSCSYEVFKHINEFACGTTNIDYSSTLYNEFQKIRTYKDTQFTVDPSGFNVATEGEDDYKEVKIDLPDSWVRGFLQVSSAMTMPATRLEMHPMDVYNICFFLKRHKAKASPRSLRFVLTPNEPIKLIFEPWGYELVCPRSIYHGSTAQEIRIWGRDRLTILERLIPIAKGFSFILLGTGLPSFYIADLGDMAFTLGLSGWTANDWSRAGNFDLMASRVQVDQHTAQTVFNALKTNWREDLDSLSQRLMLDRGMVAGALQSYTQAGRAIFDLNKGVYRVRELSREVLPMDKLRFANDREASATRFIESGDVTVRAEALQGGRLKLEGSVKDKSKTQTPSMTIDSDQRIVEGKCGCDFFFQNKLFKGPCEHLLAIRLAHSKEN